MSTSASAALASDGGLRPNILCWVPASAGSSGGEGRTRVIGLRHAPIGGIATPADAGAAQSSFGSSSSWLRAEVMLALVMTLTPVSTVTGTLSPFEAASAVLTPS